MHKPGRRAQLIAALIGVFVLASLAVAAASGRLGGGDDGFQVDSSEPSTDGTSTGEGSAGDGSGAVDPGDGADISPPASPGGNATSGPDTPVSSDDSVPPPPVPVPDPSSAFSGIRNFEQCAAAGYPVAESYPEQCRTPDGRLFVRVIE